MVSTADANRGRCAPCWKRRFSARLREGFLGFGGLLGLIIALPFLGIWTGIRRVYRNAKFPYSRTELLDQILRVHSDPRVARLYRVGVVDGYFEPVDVMLTGIPANLPYCRGREDGSGIRRGDIEPSAVPTYLQSLSIPIAIKPAVRV